MADQKGLELSWWMKCRTIEELDRETKARWLEGYKKHTVPMLAKLAEPKREEVKYPPPKI